MARFPDQPRRRAGRHTKDEEVARALAALGCEPTAIDPLRILAAIAADGTKPPTARVAACKVLLAARGRAPAEEDNATAGGVLGDRATRLLAAARRGH